MHHRPLLIAALTAAVAGCAAQTDSPEAAPPTPPNVVTYTALDFAFDGPSEIPAGPTTFKMLSNGKELHHIQLVKLEEGKTVDSLMAAMKAGGMPPAWAVFLGGPNAPPPGGETVGHLNLEPGNYVVMCLVDTPDKVPHLMKGMIRPLTVTEAPASAATAQLPEPTITMTLTDYAFTTDKEITAGKHVVKLVNAGPQPHEAVLIKFDAGKTLADLGAWMQTMQGPPPGAPMGGGSVLLNGKDMLFEVDITPGNWAIVCFVPDPKGGVHIDHGMVREFTIQ